MKEQIKPLEGYCPNCWGTQEYQEQIIEAAEQEKIDLNNISLRKGWIQAHAARFFEGIKLGKKEYEGGCPICVGG